MSVSQDRLMTMLPTSNPTDVQLVEATKRLLRSERATVAQVVAHLADIELRRRHFAAGHPSLYAYCVEELQLSEFEALNRIEAARAGREYPRIFKMLGDGSLSLTTVQLLARRLKPECRSAAVRGSGLHQEGGAGTVGSALSPTGCGRHRSKIADSGAPGASGGLVRTASRVRAIGAATIGAA